MVAVEEGDAASLPDPGWKGRPEKVEVPIRDLYKDIQGSPCLGCSTGDEAVH
jgi:hypothetical protein